MSCSEVVSPPEGGGEGVRACARARDDVGTSGWVRGRVGGRRLGNASALLGEELCLG